AEADVRDRGGEGRLLPAAALPDPRRLRLLVSDDDVDEAVTVDVEDPDAVVASVGPPERVASQEVPVDPLLGFAEGEEQDLLPVLPDRVVDEFHELGVLDPVVRVKDEGPGSLLLDDGVDR